MITKMKKLTIEKNTNCCLLKYLNFKNIYNLIIQWVSVKLTRKRSKRERKQKKNHTQISVFVLKTFDQSLVGLVVSD